MNQKNKVKLLQAGTYASNTDWMDFLNTDMKNVPEVSPLLNSSASSNKGIGKVKKGNKKRKAGEISGAALDGYQDELDEEEDPNGAYNDDFKQSDSGLDNKNKRKMIFNKPLLSNCFSKLIRFIK